jgi:hypothetical protein
MSGFKYILRIYKFLGSVKIVVKYFDFNKLTLKI